MQIQGVKCIQVGLGRKYKTKDGVEHRDLTARCVNVSSDSGELGSNSFFDYKFNEHEVKDAKKHEGKMLELQVDEIRQPFAGAPVNFSGKILKSVWSVYVSALGNVHVDEDWLAILRHFDIPGAVSSYAWNWFRATKTIKFI